MIGTYQELTKKNFLNELEAMDKDKLKAYMDAMYWTDPSEEDEEKKSRPVVRLAITANLFEELTSDCLRYNTTTKTFWNYDEGKWSDLKTNKVTTPVQNFGNALKEFGEKHPEFKKAFVKIGIQVGGVPKAINDVSSMVVNSSNGNFSSEDLDQLDSLINFKNGCFDLDQLKMVPQKPEHLLSKQCNVEYDPTATCPRFKLFIEQITVNEHGTPQPEKVAYLQMFLGLCLTANMDNEFFHIFYGATTRNGKTTLANAVTGILGSYAAYIPADSLDSKTKVQPNAPRPDLASIAGARVVIVGEPKKDMKLDASLIKQITGKSPIPVRRLNEATFQLRCQCKMILDSNYLPKVTDETLFTSNRIRIIPFEKHFETSEQDPLLEKKLEAEKSGILNWMIEGLKKYRAQVGTHAELLPTIECMKDYADTYEDEFRRVETFVNAVIEENGIGTYTTNIETNYNCIKARDLYDYYKGWCKDEAYIPMGFSKFKEELVKSFGKKGYYKQAYPVIDGTQKHFRDVFVGYTYKKDAAFYLNVTARY
jgi:P4 family phage/plasmid primase-like protien